MNRPLFRDTAQQLFFEENGYVKIPALSKIAAAQLKADFEALCPSVAGGFSSTFLSDESSVKEQIQKIVMPHLESVINEMFIDCKCVVYNFLAKGKSEAGALGLHQDWTFVDEAKGHISLNFWCPLVDTHERNGNLLVIPGTHRLPRVPRVAPRSDLPYLPYAQDYLTQAVAVPTGIGEALVFDNTLFHGSPPNLTDEVRVIVGALVIPNEAESVLFYQDSPNKVRMCAVDRDFYVQRRPTVEQSEKLLEIREIPEVDYQDALYGVLGMDKPKGAHQSSAPVAVAPPVTGTADAAKGFWNKLSGLFR